MKISDYNLTEEDIDDFDDLFSKRLSEEEYYILKAKLELDEIYLHKYKVYRSIRKEIEFEGMSSMALKNRFERLNQKVKRRRRIFRLYISFSVVFFFFICFLF